MEEPINIQTDTMEETNELLAGVPEITDMPEKEPAYDKINLITGAVMKPDEVKISVKQMCLNCIFCKDMKCTNEDNKKMKIEQLKSMIGGYEIKSIDIQPVKLKDPLKKCRNWQLDKERLIEWLTK